MITRANAFLRKLRRLFSRSEWSVRLLRLQKCTPSDAFGLVLIQIDGLSLRQFNRALQKGHLPFLKSLMHREGYVMHLHYSGLPSNTPAVQAELFYGVKGAVPAFSFMDRASGKVLKM